MGLKSIITSALFLILGVLVSFVFDNDLRELIRDIYAWSTGGQIRFFGKNFHLFPTSITTIVFGISFFLFGLNASNNSLSINIKHGAIWIMLFTLIMIVYSSVQAHLRIIECTSCIDGIRSVNFNEVRYDLIMNTSLLLSTIPNLIRIIKITKQSRNVG